MTDDGGPITQKHSLVRFVTGWRKKKKVDSVAAGSQQHEAVSLLCQSDLYNQLVLVLLCDSCSRYSVPWAQFALGAQLVSTSTLIPSQHCSNSGFKSGVFLNGIARKLASGDVTEAVRLLQTLSNGNKSNQKYSRSRFAPFAHNVGVFHLLQRPYWT